MPSYKHTKPGGADAGKPSGRGQTKAGVKPVDPGQTRDEHEDLAQRYTDGPDDQIAGIRTNNPNRNTDKPGIDNNKYN